ncbi:MAG: phosphatase PAP2 family protein, partial [Erysipelotrichaceae bacterium]|nr:phosphatase PAP2 family protein [Erysipelotrichaceae bacterium]
YGLLKTIGVTSKQIRKIISIVLYVLAGITVVGRLLSGVHWFTDILASIFISATLLYAFYIALDVIKPKKKIHK